MDRRLFLVLIVWTSPSFAQQAEVPRQTPRDIEVLEAVLSDILTNEIKSTPEAERQLLFSLGPPKYPERLDEESAIIHEPIVKERWKPTPRQLDRAREAASEVIQRQAQRTLFQNYRPKDKRVALWDDKAPAPPIYLQPTIYRAFAPGYSKDQQFAVVYMTYTSCSHPGSGSYGLAKHDGKWVVVFRDLWQAD